MNICGPFIRRPVMTLLLMATILFFGINAYRGLPVSDLPDVEYPTIQITTSYPGASPEIMADRVTSPLERQFATIEGIQAIASMSNTGMSTIVLQFHLDVSIDGAATDVQASINQAQPDLPPDLPNMPTFKKVNPSQTPILYYAIASNDESLGALYEYAYTFLGQRMALVDGVNEINTYGAPYAVRVQVNPSALAARGIGIDQVANTVIKANPELPVGVLYGPGVEYTVDVNGQIYQASGYEPLIIRNNNGNMVRISDVGRAIDSTQDDKLSLRYIDDHMSAPCVILAVLKEAGKNAIQVIDQIDAMLPEIKKTLPETVQVVKLFDQSEWIIESVRDVQFTLIVAFVLVCLVIFFYLGKIVNTVIPLLAIPMSIIGAFMVMYLLNYSIDILSLMAITLSIGFLVDDAIIVLENVFRHVEMGKDRRQAALDGSGQIAFTVVSTTLSLCSVFIPMIFMSGLIGRIFREFAMTIIIAVVFSSFIALTLTPLLCSRFIAEKHENQKKNWLERLSDKFNDVLLNTYKRTFSKVINFQKTTLLIGAACIAVSAGLFLHLPKDFFPAEDLGFIEGFSQSMDGTSPFKMIAYQNEIDDIIRKDDNIESFVSVGAYPSDNQGLMFLRLKPFKKRASMSKVIYGLLPQFYDIPGVQAFLRPLPLINLDIGTGGSQGAYQYSLQSYNTEELYQTAEKLLTYLKQTPGFVQVSSDMHVNQPQLKIEIDRDKAYDLNVSAQDIEQALSYAYSGGKITTINSPIDQYDVIIETVPSAYKDPSVLNKLYVSASSNNPAPNPNGSSSSQSSSGPVQVPLSAVTTWKEDIGPLLINHFNNQTSVTITFDLDNLALSDALATIDEWGATNYPREVIGNVIGSADVFQSSFADLSFLFIITIFVIYVILGILYEDFIHPLTVMSALPPATVGALLTLVCFNMTLSFYAMVGVIMLIGIVLKNGIMMIDFAEDYMRTTKPDYVEAITAACFDRLRPILMTTFSTFMGALPIALGIGGSTAAGRIPLGLAICGGLLFSQVLTLYLTPIVFIRLEKIRHRFTKKPQPTNNE